LLPLIFGKWRHFKAHVGEEKLTEASKRLWLPASSAMVFTDLKDPSIVKVVMEYLSSYLLSVMVGHKERIGWLKAIRGDSELSRWFLEEKGRYEALADLWSISFNLIREPTPDWDRALEDFQKRSPIHVSVKD